MPRAHSVLRLQPKGESSRAVHIAQRPVGDGFPTFLIAEIGINHNGELSMARALIELAARCGFDAVKFQKRTPELCVAPEQHGNTRQTLWGEMTELEYRRRLEFSLAEYEQIDFFCRKLAIPWFASCWDKPSVDFVQQFSPVCYKIASACLTDDALLTYIAAKGVPVILSTGMSTMEQIRHAVGLLDLERLLIAHSTSSYPCPAEEQNLRVISTLKREFLSPIGYSGHERELATTFAAIALGACFVERHITLDRRMEGSNHLASLEENEASALVKGVREIDRALGDGVKRIYASELSALQRLRRQV